MNARPVAEEKRVKYRLSSVLVVSLVLGNLHSARAQSEVTLLAPRPIMEPLEKLIMGFESTTKYKVKVTTGSGFVSTRAKDPVAAKALLEYFSSSPDAARIYKAAGMDVSH